MAVINSKDVFVLIACEESQAECSAFRARGFVAYSCDLQRCRRGGNPDWHIVGDVVPFLRGCTSFITQSGQRVELPRWDLIIAHPPCTYLCKVSSVHMVVGGVLQEERFQKMLLARSFFFECLNACAPFVAVENPLPMARAGLPRPSCYCQPYWFGDPFSKKTLYWTKNLPPLMASAECSQFKQFVRNSRGKYRSRTFRGIAQAIAQQWGDYVLDGLRS